MTAWLSLDGFELNINTTPNTAKKATLKAA